MPRKARIDAPGDLHHIITRGIEQRKIFYDDLDRNNWSIFPRIIPGVPRIIPKEIPKI